MTLREWADAHRNTEMKGLRLTSPDGERFRLAHAWRIGEGDPALIGMFLHDGDATEGECKFRRIPYDSWMDGWTVRL